MEGWGNRVEWWKENWVSALAFLRINACGPCKLISVWLEFDAPRVGYWRERVLIALVPLNL